MGSKFYDLLKNRIQDFYGNPESTNTEILPEVSLEERVEKEVVKKEISVEVDGGPKPGYLVLAGIIGCCGFIFLEKGWTYPAVSAGIGIVLGFWFFKAFRKRIIQKKTIQEPVEKRVQVKVENKRTVREVVPGKKSILKAGKGKIRFKVIEFRGERYILLKDNISGGTKFVVPTLKKPREFFREFDRLEKSFQNIPIFLEKENEKFEVEGVSQKVELKGLEASLMNHFFNVEYTMVNRNKSSISLPIVEGDEIASFAKHTGSLSDYDDDLTCFALSPDGDEMDEALKAWQISWPEKNELLGKVRFDAVKNKILPEFVELGQTINYSSFNFYCPDCNKSVSETILSRDYSVQTTENYTPIHFSESTQCFYQLEEKNWKCPTCDNTFEKPIPIHKMLDELLFPVYDRLMEENKSEREKDYSDVRKKEIFFRNEMKKETERIFTENFNGILGLKEEMEKMQAEIEGEAEAITFIGETMRDYQGIQSEVIEKVEQFNEFLKQEVEASSKVIKQEMDHYCEREKKLLEIDLSEIAKAKRLDDEKRDLVQREIFTNINNQFELIEKKSKELKKVITGQKAIDIAYQQKALEAAHSMEDLRKEIQRGNAITAAIADDLGIPADDIALDRLDRKLQKLIVDFNAPDLNFLNSLTTSSES